MLEAAVSVDRAEAIPDSRNPELISEDALDIMQRALSDAAETYALHSSGFSSMEPGLGAARSRFSDSQRRCGLEAGELGSRARIDQTAGDKASERTDLMNRELALWQGQFGSNLLPEQAHAALDNYERRDNAAHELRSRVERSVEFIDATTRQIAEDEKQAGAAQLELVEQKAKLGHLSQQLERIQTQLKEWTGGRAADALIAEAERELADVR
ncbi:hypothetical protein K0U00_40590, partial [Paenibacillus sepulcri]|nr:hypothetical protein [Paenibacillus sepulcri]